MIRRFCDICGEEIRNDQAEMNFQHERMKVRVLRAIDGAWNAGQVCEACVRLAVNEGERI